MIRRRATALLTVVAVVAACTGEPETELDTAEVTSGEVVETVAAVAELAPAARVTVTAPLGGEIAELLVADGDEVEQGDPLIRLTSDSLDQQIAQAEAAVEAAGALGGLGGLGGADLGALGGLAGGVPSVDLSPVFGALAGQFEATVGPLLGVLEDQAAAIEDDQARAAAEARLAEARASYRSSLDELRTAQRDARTDAANAEVAQRQAQRSAEEAQAEAAAAQERAAAAQRRQAELALAAVEARGDDLLLVAPRDGTVEFAAVGGGGGGLPDLGGLGDLGGLAGGADLGGLAGQLGGTDLAAPGGSDPASVPLAEGASVVPGQLLLTVFDLSTFRVEVEVDEIDVVEVVEGQDVTVLVDAFPQAELRGRVERVALTPTRGVAGGAVFPVEVALLGVPRDLRLRIGLTASAEIAVRRVEDATRVPTSALLRRGGQEVVFVDEGGTLREVPVTVVALGDEFAAVEGEVATGDEVVTTGVETVADGDTR